MITGGEIVRKYNETKYRVRVPIFDTAISIWRTEFDCYAISVPGQTSGYNIGDRVYIDFYENRAGEPLILGLQPVTANQKRNVSSMNIDSLNVSSKVILPTDIVIGGVSYKDIIELNSKIKSLGERILNLEKKR